MTLIYKKCVTGFLHKKKEEKHNKTILYKNSNYNLKLNTKNKKKKKTEKIMSC